MEGRRGDLERECGCLEKVEGSKGVVVGRYERTWSERDEGLQTGSLEYGEEGEMGC